MKNISVILKNHFTKCFLSEEQTEGRLIAVNEKYLAIPWKKKGQILIVDSSKPQTIQSDLSYLTGKHMDDYIHDMKIMQDYASLNRSIIVDDIIEGLGLHEVDRFDTVHNYIDTENMILRKGACAAYEDQLLIIPMNMRDGSLICRGKGNPDWNYSAPHGAGRILSRSAAKKKLNLEDYKDTMKDVFTTCVSKGTLDEAPMAYKPMEEIVSHVGDTVEILEQIKPVYNFKASD